MSAIRKRTKFSATVDSDLLETVDRYVQEHDEVNRSTVIDDALRLWIARERERAIEAQHAPPETPEEAAELESWRAIRDAAAQRLFRSR
jgi:Arc/MetJ-type ribon-helix-helix transcriptional regulator